MTPDLRKLVDGLEAASNALDKAVDGIDNDVLRGEIRHAEIVASRLAREAATALESLSAEMPEEPEWVRTNLRGTHPQSKQAEAVAYIDALRAHCAGLRRDAEQWRLLQRAAATRVLRDGTPEEIKAWAESLTKDVAGAND